MRHYNVRIVKFNNKEEVKEALWALGCDQGGVSLMAPKAIHHLIKLEKVPVKVAHILKQEMLSKGGEAAVAKGTIDFSVKETDVILMGTLKQFAQLVTKLRIQPFRLPELADAITQLLANLDYREPFELDCGRFKLEIGQRTLVMGILNITPDSFSDGGKFFAAEAALAQALQMLEAGVDIIDIGGESTRPGAQSVDADEEMRRVLPIIKALAGKVSVPISIDTYKAKVAAAAIEAGASIINDVWGLKADPDLAGVVADAKLPVVMMHNQKGTQYQDLMGDIISSLRGSINIALNAGVDWEKLIIDPGIGFGKTTEQNLEVMAQLEELQTLGLPILLGTSRKSMIGNTLNLPVDQRQEGTGATIALGIAKGADIVRVHDVPEMVRVVKMTDAMVRRRRIYE